MRYCVALPYIYTKESKDFSIASQPTRLPRAAGEEARRITQLLNCYLQVSPSAGAVLIEEETSSRSKATHMCRCFLVRDVRPVAVSAWVDGA